MESVSQAVMLSWSIPPAATLALAVTAVVYLRGWILLRRAGVPFVPGWRAASFFLGLFSLWIALASPFDTFSRFVLTAHMLQHMMLMMVAPPLILLAAPLIPLVRGLPVFAAREFAGPFLNWRVAIRAGNALTQPLVALLLMGAVMFAWHTPRLYEVALASSSWHEVEHACFFLTSLVFWWPVVQPWPSRPQWPRWTMVPYLLIADLQNTALSAILVFSDRVLYPTYATVPRLFAFSALQDQAAAGAIMWVMGSLAFVVPALVIAVECLQSRTWPEEQPTSRRPTQLSTSWVIGLAHRVSLGNGFLRRRLGSRSAEAVSFVLLFAVVGLSLTRLSSGAADGDDAQAVRLREQSGSLGVTVLAAPGDLKTGETDFSVLVQDQDSHEVLTDAVVDVCARSAAASQTDSVRASSEDSENKLLQSASVDLSSDGNWTVMIAVERGGKRALFSLPIHVMKPEAGLSLPWAYVVLVVISAVLLLAYLLRRRGAILTRPIEAEKADPLRAEARSG
jgi:putative membrane protein